MLVCLSARFSRALLQKKYADQSKSQQYALQNDRVIECHDHRLTTHHPPDGDRRLVLREVGRGRQALRELAGQMREPRPRRFA